MTILSSPALAAAATRNEFYAMDTLARGEPAAVAKMLHELGYDGIVGTVPDETVPEAIAAEGLKFCGGYHVITLAAGVAAPGEKLRHWLDAMQGQRTMLWLAVEKIAFADGTIAPPSSPEATAIAIEQVRAIARYASERGVRTVLYPHIKYWLEHFEAARDIAEKINRPDVGIAFNLCHWLRVEGSARDPLPVIRQNLSLIMAVTINGADSGDTQAMDWDRLIQPLDAGSYDVAGFVRGLRTLGYTGPIGLQGYRIKGEPREILQRSMAAWRRWTADSEKNP